MNQQVSLFLGVTGDVQWRVENDYSREYVSTDGRCNDPASVKDIRKKVHPVQFERKRECKAGVKKSRDCCVEWSGTRADPALSRTESGPMRTDTRCTASVSRGAKLSHAAPV